jgi:probable HAF family extracellular repeat protein
VAGVRPTAQLEPIGTYAIVDLGTLIGGISSYATAVADTGMVVGYSDIDLYGFGIRGGIEGFVWQDGAMKSLGALWCPCSSNQRYGTSRAFAVKNAGLIVGGSLAMTHGHGQCTPFVIHDGVSDAIELAPGIARGEARAINRKGQIAGTSIATDGTARAFLRDFGMSRNLPPLSGDASSEARAINVDGDVVGRSGTADLTTSRAVLWRDGVAIDLNRQIAEEAWTLSIATGINDVGQIVGTGLHLGQQRAFLLTRGKAVPQRCLVLRGVSSKTRSSVERAAIV